MHTSARTLVFQIASRRCIVTHDVGCIGAHRVGIRSPNDRLRRQMEGDFRAKSIIEASSLA
jgi:hypothetical protein